MGAVITISCPLVLHLNQDPLVQLGTCRGLSSGCETQLSIIRERMTTALPLKLKEEGMNVACGTEEQRPRHVSSAYLVKALLLPLSLI